MVKPSSGLDTHVPHGIILQTGVRRQVGARFWAYMWSEELEPACVPAYGGRILESPRPADGLSPPWRASP